ncbi:MAG: hypothetical protein ACOYYS_00630 [Chloroflexota bacterium]
MDDGIFRNESKAFRNVALCLLAFTLGLAAFLGVVFAHQGNDPWAARAQGTETCTVDLVNNSHDCGALAAISFVVAPSGGEAVLKLDLTDYESVRFDVTYNITPTAWTVNIGDSATNDGHGGDGGTQENDSELQMLNQTFSVFANDPTGELLLSLPDFAQSDQTVTFVIRNNRVDYINGAGVLDTFTSERIYALAGQPDAGGVNYDIYAAFNRSINNSHRAGTGVSQVVITLDGVALPTSTPTLTPTVTATPTRTPTPTPTPEPIYLPVTFNDYVSYFEDLWELEPNDEYQDANGALRFERDYFGYPNDAKDYFSFYLSDPGRVAVTLKNHTGQGVQMLLYHQAPTANGEVARDYEAPYQLTYAGPAGWYYLYLYTPAGYNSSYYYTLRVDYTADARSQAAGRADSMPDGRTAYPPTPPTP